MDFHWGDYTYNLEGGSEIFLTELLEVLINGASEGQNADSDSETAADGTVETGTSAEGTENHSLPSGSAGVYANTTENARLAEIIADMSQVKSVTFSNPELVKVEKKSSEQAENDWLLTSLAAFDTEETLTIGLANGEEIVVKVTDAASGATREGLDAAIENGTTVSVHVLRNDGTEAGTMDLLSGRVGDKLDPASAFTDDKYISKKNDATINTTYRVGWVWNDNGTIFYGKNEQTDTDAHRNTVVNSDSALLGSAQLYAKLKNDHTVVDGIIYKVSSVSRDGTATIVGTINGDITLHDTISYNGHSYTVAALTDSYISARITDNVSIPGTIVTPSDPTKEELDANNVSGQNNNTTETRDMIWKKVSYNSETNSVDITLSYFQKRYGAKLDFIFVVDETGTMVNNVTVSVNGTDYTETRAAWARLATLKAAKGILEGNTSENGFQNRVYFMPWGGSTVKRSGFFTDYTQAITWFNSNPRTGGTTNHRLPMAAATEVAQASAAEGRTPVVIYLSDFGTHADDIGFTYRDDLEQYAIVYPVMIYPYNSGSGERRIYISSDRSHWHDMGTDPNNLIGIYGDIIENAIKYTDPHTKVEDVLSAGLLSGTSGTYSDGKINWPINQTNAGGLIASLENGIVYTKTNSIPLEENVIYSGYLPTNGDVTVKNGDNELNKITADNSPLLKSSVTLLLKGTDTSGTPLAGATFTLTRGSNTWELTTDNEGKIVLPWGETDTVGATTAESTVAFPADSTYTLTQNITVSGFVRPAGSWTLSVGDDYKITATTNASPMNTNRTRDMAAKAGKFEIYNDAAPKIIYHYNQPVGTKIDAEEPVSFAVDATVRIHTLGGVYNTQVEGYTFTGWAETENATSATYPEGDEITVFTKGTGVNPDSLELYGVWLKEGDLVPLTIEKKWDENIDWTSAPYADQKAANSTINFIIFGCTDTDSTGTQITAYADAVGTTQVSSISQSDLSGAISEWAKTVYVPKSVGTTTFNSYRIEEPNLQVAGGKGSWDTPAEDYQSSSDSFVTVTTDKLPEGVKIYAPKNVDSVNLDLDLSTNEVVNNITSVTIEYGVNNNQYIFRTKAEFENTKTLGPGSSINPKYEHVYQLKLLTNAAGHKPVFRKLYINDVEYPVGPGNLISRAVITTGGNITTRPEDLDVSASTTTVSYLVKESQDRKLTVTNSFELARDVYVPLIVQKEWDLSTGKSYNRVPITIYGVKGSEKTALTAYSVDIPQAGKEVSELTENDTCLIGNEEIAWAKIVYVPRKNSDGQNYDSYEIGEPEIGTIDPNNELTPEYRSEGGQWEEVKDGYTEGYIKLHRGYAAGGDTYKNVRRIEFYFWDDIGTKDNYYCTSVDFNSSEYLNWAAKDGYYYIKVRLPASLNVNKAHLIFDGYNSSGNPKVLTLSNDEIIKSGVSGHNFVYGVVTWTSTAGTSPNGAPSFKQGEMTTSLNYLDEIAFLSSYSGNDIKTGTETLYTFPHVQAGARLVATNHSYICKIVDGRSEDGQPVPGSANKYEHGFSSLNAAVKYARDNKATLPMDSAHPVAIEMLVDYVIPQSDKVTLDQATDNIIITTAATSGGVYNFTPTFTAAQGRLAADSTSTAILSRGWAGESSIGSTGTTTLTALFNLPDKGILKTENIIFDGKSQNASGALTQYNGRSIANRNGKLTIGGGTQFRNHEWSSAVNGGAVFNRGNDLTVGEAGADPVIFTNCFANGANGGAFYADGSNVVTVTNAVFENCRSGGEVGGGAIYQAGGTLSVTDVRFGNESDTSKACKAGTSGGAIYTGASSVTISGSEFYGAGTSTNTAVNGGAIYTNSGTGSLSITGSVFEGFKVAGGGESDLSKGCGGAVNHQGTGSLTVSNTTFGALVASAKSKEAKALQKSDLDTAWGCQADHGGAIFTKSTGEIRVGNVNFYSTKATQRGGGVYIEGANPTSRKLVFENSVFVGSEATAHYGAAVCENNDNGRTAISASFENCIFTDTTAKRGGAALLIRPETLNIDGCTFIRCNETYADDNYGGAVYILNNVNTAVKNTTFTDCQSVGSRGRGGAIYNTEGASSTTLENVSITGSTAKLGGAVYTAGNLTIKQTGTGTSEIKNCSASDTNGGAVQVATGKTMTFEGNVVIYDNKDSSGNQKNVVLQYGVNNDYNKTINTSGSGLGTDAHIGVYVVGNNTDPYNNHGKWLQPFGTATSNTEANLEGFTNDRDESLFGVNAQDMGKSDTTDKLIYWGRYICKIEDQNASGKKADGSSVYEHPFSTLNRALTYARNNVNPAMSGTNAVAIQMLVDYEIPSSDKVTLNQTNDNIIITTAATSGGVYNFTPTFAEGTAAGERLSTDSNKTAILKRGSDVGNNSLFTVSNSNASLRTENIILDGAGLSVATQGTIIKASNGSLTIAGDTTVRNSKTNVSSSSGNNGGAIYAHVPVLFTTKHGETILFKDCTTNREGGVIETEGKKLTIDNKGTLKAEDCSASCGGFICTDTSGEVEISNSGTIEVSGCRATSNNGGAIFTGIFKAENNSGSISFTNCTASNGGAIIANRGDSGSDTFVLTNTATGTASFTNCIASYGGAVYVTKGKCKITGADAKEPITFEGCTASSNGGAIYQAEGNALTLTNVTFGKAGTVASGCTAVLEGGCVYTKATTPVFTDCSFYYGKAGSSTSTSETHGGGVSYHGSGTISFYGCVFDHCGTENQSNYNGNGHGNGGAVYTYDGNVNENSKLIIDKSSTRGSSFTECYSHRFGGAVMVETNGGALEIKNTSFEGCRSNILGGGAVSMDSFVNTIEDCTFKGCYTNSKSTSYGGGAINTNPDGGSQYSSQVTTVSVSNSTFEDCWSAVNGGAIDIFHSKTTATLENVSIDGHTTGNTTSLYTGTANAKSGAAIYSKGNLTIKQTGTGKSEIKNCSASDTNGGAVQVASGKTMTFEGNVVIFNNKGTGTLADQQKNVVLDQNNNTTINTSIVGLGSDARIGVYVTGTKGVTEDKDTEPYKSHGGFEDDFGTYPSGGSTDNFDAFTNDRNGMYGEACPDHANKIRWLSYLCKITDKDGNLLYKDAEHKDAAVYKFLKTQDGDTNGKKTGGFNAAQGTLYTVDDGTEVANNAPVQVQMLRNYTQPSTDQPTVSGGRAVTFTTANKTATDNLGYSAGDIYIYERGSDTTKEADRATITRGADGGSMFTVDGDSASLTTKKLIFNGGNALSTQLTAGTANGGIVNATNGNLTVGEATVMKNSTAVNGGAIYSAKGVTVIGTSANRVQFWDCNASSGNGGAIYTAGGSMALISISDADFEDCYTNKTNGKGGAMYFTNGTQTLTDVEVDGVTDDHKNSKGIDAEDGGGIYLENGNLKLTHVALHDCHVNRNGGGIYMADGTLTVNGNKNGQSEFKECAAPNGNGGTIYNGSSKKDTTGVTVSIVNTTFDGHFQHPHNLSGPDDNEPISDLVDPGDDNEFGEDGSGGNSQNEDPLDGNEVNPEETHLDDNVQNAKNGGAIYMESGTLSLGGSNDADAVTINNCTVTTNGGAIYNASSANAATATVKLENVTIDGHDQSRGGYPLPATFVNAVDGGAIYMNTGTLSITGGEIRNCRAKTNGGAIYNGSSSKMNDAANKATVLINGTIFTGRTSDTSDFAGHANAANGGAIYNYIGNLRVVNNAQFNYFIASQDGGVIYDNNSGSYTTDIDTVNLQNVTIDGHYGGMQDGEYNAQRGGAIFTANQGAMDKGGSTRLSNCQIYDCAVSSQGGAIFNQSARRDTDTNVDEPTIHLVETVIDGNETRLETTNNAERGGAILISNGTLVMEDSTIRNCKTTMDGGGITSYGGGTQFKNQSGEFGVNDYTVKLKNTTIDNCSSQNGGGISIKQILTLLNSTITNCAATDNGGAIYLFGEDTNKRFVRMNDSKSNANVITGNTAGQNGAGIYVREKSVVSIAGAPNFGGTAAEGDNINTVGTGTNAKREDIYIAGYLGLNGADPRLAESLIVTGKLYEDLITEQAKGQIWVGAQQQDNEDNNHWDTLKQFAKFADALMTGTGDNMKIDKSKLSESDVEKIYAAFRNATLTDVTYGMTGDGQTGGIQCIYWEGVQDRRKVILRKVGKKVEDSTYKLIEGAKFTIHKGNSSYPYTPQGETAPLRDLDSKASGVFWIGTLPYGVYYLHETTVPDGYTGHVTSEGRWFFMVVGDDTVPGSRNGAYMSEGYGTRDEAKAAYDNWKAGTTP